MIYNEDLIRIKGDIEKKKHRLDNLAKVCSNVESDEMKSMWYNKLKKLAEQYKMMDYFRKLIH